MIEFYFLILVLILSSCDEDTVEPVQLGDASSIDVVLDVHRFNTFKNNRNSDPFEIRGISREGDLIKLTVQYGGGCEPHDFQILWNQKYDELENDEFGFNMTDLIIHHNANGDLCEAALTDTLYIYLDDLDNEIDWDKYAVRLQNGSRVQDVVAFFVMEPVWESEECLIEVEMERVICGDGLLGNVWFSYAENNYLQPASIASFMLIDPDLPVGKYKIGVRVTTWNPNPDAVICTAFPGYSVPVDIYCLEHIE